MKRQSVPAILFGFLSLSAWAQLQEGPFLFEGLTYCPDGLVFALSGQLYLVGHQGGVAERLETGPDEQAYPVASPDGRLVAFINRTSGNGDVYLFDREAGRSRRVTWYPGVDYPVVWSPDGGLVLASGRQHPKAFHLFRAGLSDKAVLPLSVGAGTYAAFSPDGQRMAFTPYGLRPPGHGWDTYRGGNRSPLWVQDLETGESSALLEEDFDPYGLQWDEAGLYFLSNRDGVGNLYRLGNTGKPRQLTDYLDFGIDALCVGGGQAFFVRHGSIYRWASDGAEPLPLRVPLDLRHRRTRLLKTQDWLQEISLNRKGNLALAVARGEVFAFEPEGKYIQNLTNSSSAREFAVCLGPGDRQVAYFCDEAGTLFLRIREREGGRLIRSLRLENQDTDYRDLCWSPDGAYLSFSDNQMQLWVYEVEKQRLELVAQTGEPSQQGYQARWSPDGRLLAYTLREENRVRRIYVQDMRTGMRHRVSPEYMHAFSPRFDASGRYLYFLGEPQGAVVDLPWAVMSSLQAQMRRRTQLHVVVLDAQGEVPFFAASGDPNPLAPWDILSTGPDPSGLHQRVLTLPLSFGPIIEVISGSPGVLFVVAMRFDAAGEPKPALRILDMRDPQKTQLEMLGVTEAYPASDVAVALVHQAGGWFKVWRDQGRWQKKSLSMPAFMAQINAVDEWSQIFWETVRLLRAYFYDPNLHGFSLVTPERDGALRLPLASDHLDLAGEMAAYLPALTSRRDLDVLLSRVLRRLSTSHFRLGGGEEEASFNFAEGVGLLGVDWQTEADRYRFGKIYMPAPEEALLYGLASPLVGLDGPLVREGDLLLAVNGVSVDTSKSIYHWFVGLAGKRVRLTVGDSADGAGSRTVEVMPLRAEGLLRKIAWASANRERVAGLSGGKVCYVYVPAFSMEGFEAFVAAFYEAKDGRALLIDLRFNGGGITSDTGIEMLCRKALYGYQFRTGAPLEMPFFAHDGPKGLLINQWNASAAETFALMFRLADIGPVIGMPTIGAGIGVFGDQPRLVDGTYLAIPNRAAFDPSGNWGIENTGVQPTQRVAPLPGDTFAGADRQLEQAVRELLQRLKSHKPKVYQVPAFPNYSGKPN